VTAGAVPPVGPPGAVWDDVVGQPEAVARLRSSAGAPVHAYLFVGPAGSTKLAAARAFAAVLLTGDEDREQRDARLVLRGEHPDVREVRRVGAAIAKPQATEIVRLASFAPIEGARKVLVLDEFHLLSADGAGVMLKTIEEPPDSTIFVILCDFVPHELITIASRCARIEFRAVDDDTIVERLVAEGVDRDAAANAARAAHGNVRRARLLATDPALAERREAFADAPHRLDGTGSVAVGTAATLLALIEDAAEPLLARQAEEADELDARIKAHGERGSGRKQLEERHKRELRRHRTDELRSGLATLAATYRDALTHGTATDPEACTEAVHRIHAALEALERNPNERLLLESLLWSLPDATGVR
jgi:DNA polymerase-3 subunit delta'